MKEVEGEVEEGKESYGAEEVEGAHLDLCVIKRREDDNSVAHLPDAGDTLKELAAPDPKRKNEDAIQQDHDGDGELAYGDGREARDTLHRDAQEINASPERDDGVGRCIAQRCAFFLLEDFRDDEADIDGREDPEDVEIAERADEEVMEPQPEGIPDKLRGSYPPCHGALLRASVFKHCEFYL